MNSIIIIFKFFYKTCKNGLRLFNVQVVLAVITYYLIIFLISLIPFSWDLGLVDFGDIEYTDFYYNSDDFKRNQEIDTNIILIDIGNLNRSGIAKQIEIINSYNPKVIALYVQFPRLRDSIGDNNLANALQNSKNVVLSYSIFKEGNNKSITKSHHIFSDNKVNGFGNLSFNPKDLVVREFDVKMKIEDSINYSFPFEIVKAFDKDKANNFLTKNIEKPYIYYKGNINNFFHINTSDLLNKRFDGNVFKNKIVIMGFLGEDAPSAIEDYHYTPLNETKTFRLAPDMPGTVINANIVSMILNEKYIYNLPPIIIFLFKIIFTYFLFSYFYYLFTQKRNYYDLISKFSSYTTLIIIIYFSLKLFSIFKIRFEISGFILVLLFGPDFFEIYFHNIRDNIRKLINLFLPAHLKFKRYDLNN